MLLLLGACGGGEVAPAGPSSDRFTPRPTGSVEGAPLGYLEYVPPGYGDGTPRPLLVFLHTLAENGDGSEEALDLVTFRGIPWLIKSDAWPQDRPFIVLMPQTMSGCPSADAIDSFLKFAIDHYKVDRNRVYLTGASCGADGTLAYLGAQGDEIVAAAVVTAADASSAFALYGCALGRVPIWAFHGEDDEFIPLDRIVGPLRELKACTVPRPMELQLTIYPRGSHRDAWDRTYDLSAGHDIYAWVLRHERP
jgi:predicted peptidase